ncbi:MAG: hypothetical protein ACYCW6_30395, partial [Candidatus Xenobia bacterium]
VRLMHVEAGHSSDEVLHDLGYAMKVLTPDGVIVADDTTSETGWRGVYYAVRDFVVANGLEKQWFIPHFTNKAVIVRDAALFEELYGSYRAANCSDPADKSRNFNLADVSFKPVYGPGDFLALSESGMTRWLRSLRLAAGKLEV